MGRINLHIIYIAVAISTGFVMSTIGVPAGWLIGSIVTGIIWGVTKGSLHFGEYPFKIALSLVVANIGLRLDLNTIYSLRSYLLPFIFTLLLTILCGYGLSLMLHKKSSVDGATAFFCCLPGGASEIIALSKEYGADDRIVAAFHTLRITSFVLIVPFLLGQYYKTDVAEVTAQVAHLELSHFLFFPAVTALTLFLDRRFRFPGGTLLFAMAISFVISTFIIPIPSPPSYVTGIGQAIIGSMVGIRFDKQVLVRLLGVGKIAFGLIGLYLGFSFIIGYLFHLMTKLPFSVSLLGTVPAGAAEMSATSVALHLSPSTVASLQIIRVVVLFLLLPWLIKVFEWRLSKKEESLPSNE